MIICLLSCSHWLNLIHQEEKILIPHCKNEIKDSSVNIQQDSINIFWRRKKEQDQNLKLLVLDQIASLFNSRGDLKFYHHHFVFNLCLVL